MPADYGRLSARDQERLRAARRRAGLVKQPKPKPPPRDTRTVSNVRAETAQREKARRDFPTPQSLASPEGISRLREVTSERNRKVAARGPANRSGLRDAADVMFGLAVWQDPRGFVHGLKEFSRYAQEAKDTLTDPGASRREKLEAAGAIGTVAGGFGGGFGVRKGKKPPLGPKTAVEAGAEEIVEALPEAKKLRRQQEAGYSAEKAKRTAKAAQARERAGGGEAGKRAARAEFKGELPKLPFTKLAKTFGEADSELRKVFQPQVDSLMDNISAHPAMGGLQYRIENTQEALRKTLDGVTPTKSEIKLLESVFGEEAAEHFKWMRGRDKIIKALNIPRSLMASYDISRTFRQDLVALVRHPVIVGRNWPKMIKAGRDPEAARTMLEDIVANPRYEEAIEDGLALTDYRGPARTIEEDMIGAEYAERIPVIGKGVRFSNRAFNVGGAKNRMDIYDLLMNHAEKQGKDLTKTERRHLTNVINAQTGRGNLDFGFSPASGSKVMEQAGPLLTVGLFSPRLIAARVAFLNPVYYARLSGPARVEAMRSFLHLMAAGSAVLWAASQIPGVDVGMDPRSSDFGKIKAGNTRIDIWGGFQQYIVNGYRYARKETKSTTTGQVTPKTREEILWNFASGKAAPIPAYLRDFHRGETFDRQPFDPLKSAAKSVVPLNFQNAYEGFKESPATGAASAGLGAVGFGMQTYPPATPEQLKRARQAERGPAHVRDHEDRMAELRKGRAVRPDAVKTSRTMRDLDEALAKAEIESGDYKTRLEVLKPFYFKEHPQRRAIWEAKIERDGYEKAYTKMRNELRRPLDRALDKARSRRPSSRSAPADTVSSLPARFRDG